MGTLSPIHWLIVIVVILLLFGPSRLAGVGKGLGEGIRSFKKGLGEDSDEKKSDDEPKKLVDSKPSDSSEKKSDEKQTG